MPLITPDEACAQDGPSSAACAARDSAEIARRALSMKTCARLFPNQQVMQTACISSCRSYTSGDGQDCAFSFSRSLRDVAVESSNSNMLYGSVAIVGALVCAVCWAVLSARRKSRAGSS